MTLRYSALVFCAACTTTPSASPDAAADAGEPDAAIDAAIVSRWSAAEPIAELASAADERFPSLTAAGRVIYFTRTEMIGSFVVNVPYAATRASIVLEFEDPVRPVAWGASSIFDQEHHPDHLEWFFWRGLGQLGHSTRPSTGDPWSFPVDLGVDGFSPSITRDGLSLYFVDFSNAVAVMTRDDRAAPFATPALVPLAGELPIQSIDVSTDQLTLLITADPASPEAGVYLAVRPSIDAGFAAPRRIEGLDGPFESARFRADELEIVAGLELGGDRNLYRSQLIQESF